MMERAPNASLLQAELLATQAQLQNPAAPRPMIEQGTPSNMVPQGGNIAAANGLRQPGLGMGESLQGSPTMGEPNMGPR